MKNSLLLLIGALLIVRPVEAEPLPLSHTEYTAVKILETPDGQFTQRVFHSFGNERIEMKMQSMGIS